MTQRKQSKSACDRAARRVAKALDGRRPYDELVRLSRCVRTWMTIAEKWRLACATERRARELYEGAEAMHNAWDNPQSRPGLYVDEGDVDTLQDCR